VQRHEVPVSLHEVPVIGEERPWDERWWFALGSDAHVQIAGGPPGLAEHAIHEVERLERCWSRFRGDSELSALNADPASSVRISGSMTAVLHRAVEAWRLTDGWFDPTVVGCLEEAGYRRSFVVSEVPRGELDRCRPAPGLDGVEVDLRAGIVRRPPGTRFDLGGIGKGLAADLVAVQLLERGATSVCVALGGDVRVAGVAPEGGWRVPVELPPPSGAATSEVGFDAELTDGAIVASTTRYRTWTTADGHLAHHLIDPRTGRPTCSDVTTVIVVAAEAWWAEVLAKAALLAGPVDGRRLLEMHGVTGRMVAASSLDAVGAS
jgi:thiamine biosynthesis lipoprotein